MDSRGFELGCDGPSVLVVGVDGSDTSWRAVYYAFGLARRQRSTVVAVFAVLPIAALDGSTDTWSAAKEVADELEEAITMLAEEQCVAAEFVRVQRDPIVALAEVAKERRADAVVIGAGQVLGRRLFGPRVLSMVRRCRCPVTVVP